MHKFKLGQKVLWKHCDVENKGPYKATISEILEGPFTYRLKLDDGAFTPLAYEFELEPIEDNMKTTFQELKKFDEFTDETGIKYRKVNETKATIINHPVLAGTEVSINPGVTVDKIVKLEMVGNLNTGQVVKLPNNQYGIKLCYETGAGIKTWTASLILHISKDNPKVVKYDSDTEFEVVGHINLGWPQ